MEYHFNVELAEKYGVDKAVLLHNIAFWIKKNEASEKNYHNGMYWTYNSASAFTKLFPFWKEQKIKRMLQQLEDDGELLSGSYNKRKYDRTKWYTLSVRAISQNLLMDGSKMTNGLVKNDRPIPYSKPYRKTDTKPTNSKEFVEEKKSLSHSQVSGTISKELSVPKKQNYPQDINNVKLLVKLIEENNPLYQRKPLTVNMDKWCNDLRLMREQDKFTDKEIEFLIRWSQQDDFWKSNILSTSKLRKQAINLVNRAKQDKSNNILEI